MNKKCKTLNNEVKSFIRAEIAKAKNEGYSKGLNQKIDYDKEGWEELVADEQIKAIDKFKAELREKVEGMMLNSKIFTDGLPGFNEALSEVLKLLP